MWELNASNSKSELKLLKILVYSLEILNLVFNAIEKTRAVVPVHGI